MINSLFWPPLSGDLFLPSGRVHPISSLFHISCFDFRDNIGADESTDTRIRQIILIHQSITSQGNIASLLSFTENIP